MTMLLQTSVFCNDILNSTNLQNATANERYDLLNISNKNEVITEKHNTNNKRNQKIVILNVLGNRGIGNQLTDYAASYALAKRTGSLFYLAQGDVDKY